MKTIRNAIIIVFCIASELFYAANTMPIMGFWGVPEWRTSDNDFSLMNECGFNVSIGSYSSLESFVKACRYADKHNIKILGRCPEVFIVPRKAAITLRKEPGFWGYLLKDEPSVTEIFQLQKTIDELKLVDSTHIFYINLLPYLNPDIEGRLHVKTYPEYLKAAAATSCQYLSFDFYPVTTAGLRPSWFHNLEMVRKESLASGKPFWGFALSVPHDVPFSPDTYYPTPTIASLRLQIYSNLAYGAQGIQYFTYWTPSNKEGFNYHNAPISHEGKKTNTYFIVQQMNRELKTVARLFYGATVKSAHHLGALAEGTTRLDKIPTNLRSLKVVGRQGAIISQLEKDGHQFLAIVNKSHEMPLTVRVQALNSTPRHLTKTLQEEPMKNKYTITAGDILLFRLK